MSTLEVNKITPISGGTTVTLGDSGDTFNLASGATAGFGKIGQVIQATSTSADSQSTSSGTFYGVGAGVNITPIATTSKILMTVSLSLGNSANGNSVTRLVRSIGGSDTNLLVNSGGSAINGTFGGFFDSDGNVLRTVNFSFLDSPSTTSQCTYTTQIATNGSNTVYINRSASDTVRGSSSMICMEVLA